jgi:HK97 family phage prohead protease
MERRYLSTDIEFRAQADGKLATVIGYGAVFNSRSALLFGEFYEQITPGAFARALKSNPDIKSMLNHSPNMLLGSTAAKTLRLSEDERGLRYELDPANTSAGRDAVELIGRGDLRGSSFGFRLKPGGDKWERRDGDIIRTINEFEWLMDVSPVAFPAYPETTADVRSVAEGLRKTFVFLPGSGVDLLRRKLDLCERD